MSNPVYHNFNPGMECFYDSIKWMTTCDTMIVSTQPLKEYYNKNAGTNCTVIKNCVDVNKVPTVRKHIDNDRIRIVWGGSNTHLEDLKIIQPVIKKIKDEYGKKIKFTMIGYNGVSDVPMKYEPIEGNDKEKKLIYQHIDLKIKYDKYIQWINPVDEYIERLSGMHFDIGLCPLKDNLFNRSKSNLKWMEYSLCEVATIASNVDAYKDINNNVDGLLVNNDENSWYLAIKKLIKEKTLRNKLAKNAKKRIIKDFDINKNWTEYEKVFDNLLNEKKNDK